jgi:hypothetical protein
MRDIGRGSENHPTDWNGIDRVARVRSSEEKTQVRALSASIDFLLAFRNLGIKLMKLSELFLVFQMYCILNILNISNS